MYNLPEKQAVKMHWLDDPGLPMSLQQVIQHYESGDFQPLEASLGRGFIRSSSWLQLTLTPGQLASYDYLWMEPSQLNEVEVYYQTNIDASDAASYQQTSLGDHTLSDNKPVQHFRMLFPLEQIRFYQSYSTFSALEEYRLFIRIRSNSTHSLSARLLTETAMIQDSSHYLFFYAGFSCIAFILAAFSLFVAVRLKDRIYFWYGAYLVTILMIYLPVTGTLFVLFDNVPPLVADLLSGGATGLGFFCFSMLILNLLRTKGTPGRWLSGYLKLTAGLGLVQLVVSPFDMHIYIGSVISINAVAFSVILMVCFSRWVWQGNISDRFIFSALFLTVLGLLVNFSRLSGWLPENMVTIHAFQFSSLIHMLLLNQAFAERVMSAERQAVKLARDAEQKANELAADKNQKLIAALEKEQSTRESQERFIDMISHEYRTPLSILKTNLEILELKEPVGWSGRHNLHAMQQAADRLQEVFDKSVKGAGWKESAEQAEQRVELVTLFDHFMDEAHVMWSSVKLEYQVDVAFAWYKNIDPTLMKTAVFNLVDNARKYTDSSAPIRVRLKEDAAGCGLVFEVSNPIAATSGFAHRALAEKYTRGANSVGTSGLGMGLSLVQQILSLSDDRLELEEQRHSFVARVVLSAEPNRDEAVYSVEY